MSQAANTYASVQTKPDGGTLSTVPIPSDARRIVAIGAAVVIDGAHTADTGNNFTLKLSGTGMVDGEQELIVGSMASQETGTSVTGEITLMGAWYQPTDIRVKPGQDINVSAAFDGTDPGTPFLVITLVIA